MNIDLKELGSIRDTALKQKEVEKRLRVRKLNQKRIELLKTVATKIVTNLPKKLTEVAQQGSSIYFILQGNGEYDLEGETLYGKGHEHYKKYEKVALSTKELLPYVVKELRKRNIPFIQQEYMRHDCRCSGDEYDYDNGMVADGEELLIKF
jgi:hypothetical protein